MPATVSYEVTDGIAVITIDNPPVNATSAAVRKGCWEALDKLAADDAVLICAGRTFIAGADITEFDKPIVDSWLSDVVEKFEASDKPVVAIHGTALGGGLETAMGCHYRCAVPSARVGLPEVHLGLLPGATGTPLKRVSQLDVDATGVDDAFYAGYERQLARKPRVFFTPFQTLKCVRAAVDQSYSDALITEWRLFNECKASTYSQAQRYLFFAEREVARISDVPKTTPVREINSVAVISAGTMGEGIAMNFVNAGMPVTVLEADHAGLERGLGVMRKSYSAAVGKGRMTQALGVPQVEISDDVIFVNGYGMPRYRGGPMKYADMAGLDNILAAVEKYRARYGDLWWTPAPLLEQPACSGSSFQVWNQGRFP